MKKTINSIRRKAANVISPDKSQSYPFVELNWATPQSENRRSLERAHVNFKKEFGRSATSDKEAWEWDREQLNRLMLEMGLEPSCNGTEYDPALFIEDNKKSDSQEVTSL